MRRVIAEFLLRYRIRRLEYIKQEIDKAARLVRTLDSEIYPWEAEAAHDRLAWSERERVRLINLINNMPPEVRPTRV